MVGVVDEESWTTSVTDGVLSLWTAWDPSVSFGKFWEEVEFWDGKFWVG